MVILEELQTSMVQESRFLLLDQRLETELCESAAPLVHACNDVDKWTLMLIPSQTFVAKLASLWGEGQELRRTEETKREHENTQLHPLLSVQLFFICAK
ncbi:hypothetical protein AMECASPLE_003361 [Ameca splendens]|uniref:Uncharacterized protein n=1 Tax=Ameca splendens TaxID=208324 RepID=A0ABV0ZK75_9TELE